MPQLFAHFVSMQKLVVIIYNHVAFLFILLLTYFFVFFLIFDSIVLCSDLVYLFDNLLFVIVRKKGYLI